MSNSGATRINSYAGYGIACAAVWALILAVAQRRLEPGTRTTLRLACAGWWSGWTSATIARVLYPPPKKLEPRGRKRLGAVSIVLIAVGLVSVNRLFATRKQTPSATDKVGQ